MSKVNVKRPPKYKTFDGKRYERAGMSPTARKNVALDWANFQRKENKLSARVVPSAGGYEIYIRRHRHSS